MADELESVATENERMRQESANLRERLEQFESLESSIQAALVHAEQAANDLRQTAVQEAEDLRESSRREVEILRQSLQREAENLRQSADREAELTVQEAQVQAHQVLAEASARIERLQESYESLRDVKRRFTGDFRRLLESYLEAIDEAEVAPAWPAEESPRRAIGGPTDSPEPLEDESSAGDPEAGDTETAEIPLSVVPEEEHDAPAAGSVEPGVDEVPETEEPEYDPSSLETGPPEEEEFPRDSGAGEDVEWEEPMPDETKVENGTEDIRGAGETNGDEAVPEDAGDETGDENRMFRASRYLRRRD